MYLLSILITISYNSVICHAKQLFCYIKVQAVQLIEISGYGCLYIMNTVGSFHEAFCSQKSERPLWNSEEKKTSKFLFFCNLKYPCSQWWKEDKMEGKGMWHHSLWFHCPFWTKGTFYFVLKSNEVSLRKMLGTFSHQVWAFVFHKETDTSFNVRTLLQIQ